MKTNSRYSQLCQFMVSLTMIGGMSLLVAGCASDAVNPHGQSDIHQTDMSLDINNNLKIKLGEDLFFEKRLSLNEDMSCGTCHKPELGFADGRTLAIGFSGKQLKRHTPSIYNLASAKRFFWDGRSTSLEDQALQVILSPDELNNTVAEVIRRLSAIPQYQSAFEAIYTDGVKIDNVLDAIATYERSLMASDTPRDRYLRGDTSAMTTAAQRGMKLFNSRKTNCFVCHSGEDFTDGQFHNTGIGGDDMGRSSLDRVGSFKMRPYPFFQTQKAFKTPGLRNVALSPPYMHDGSIATLQEVVQTYNRGGQEPDSYGKSIDVKKLHLSEQEVSDLVAFLEALTSPVVFAKPSSDFPVAIQQ